MFLGVGGEDGMRFRIGKIGAQVRICLGVKEEMCFFAREGCAHVWFVSLLEKEDCMKENSCEGFTRIGSVSDFNSCCLDFDLEHCVN